jgi:2,3-dihydroxyphenylpropionate 1,2-dioxygenase
MQIKLICASHSPLIYFPAQETPDVAALRESLATVRSNVERFDPELVVMFGCDHYGGHQMASMPAFCVGVEATALPDVGGTPGKLRVPRDVAVRCVNALRDAGVDVAVSYAMEVDHGFSQTLKEGCGSIDRYPVLPIFVCCLQPPFVPFKRARALGTAIAQFVRTLDVDRVLLVGTGGLSHDPEKLFPAIDDVSQEWRPYHLFGNKQSEVTRQTWMDYETQMHHTAAQMLGRNEFPIDALKISEKWDRSFLALLERGDLASFDDWTPQQVIGGGGFGAMETLVWVAAAQAMDEATGQRPKTAFYRGMPEVAIGFAVAETDPVSIRDTIPRAEVA